MENLHHARVAHWDHESTSTNIHRICDKRLYAPQPRFMESPDVDRILPWDLEPFMLGRAACPTAPMGVHPRSDRIGKETEPCQRFMERSP
jgi:hypothetical protein